ncbi:MAG TPA: isochorismatase family protein [Deltaproteobacteria bacterium]|nr:isochorismatase family protein [Deltaproteobacteria bacterium]
MNDYLLHPEDCMLMVVDIQERLYDAMEKGFREVFLGNSTILLETAAAFGIPIIVSEQYPKGLGTTLPEVKSRLGTAPRYEKLAFSCCRDAAIKAALDASARKKVIVAGIEAHVCVFQTVIDLLGAGYRVTVADDAVCSRRASDRSTALFEMGRAGALLYSTEMIAFALLEKAGTPQFKQLSPLFR